MFNIQKAVSRLDFAPKLKEIKLTDIKNGVGVFTPVADKTVSFIALKETLKKAGYKLASAKVNVEGKLGRDADAWWIVAGTSGQRFDFEGDNIDQALHGAAANTQIKVAGDWKTVGEGKDAREVISLQPAKKTERLQSDGLKNAARTESVEVVSGEPLSGSPLPVAPIRTTSPGLTVYRGGAFVPRYIYTRQELGTLKVNRNTLLLGFSYTPTQKLQLEVELPVTRISFTDGAASSSESGVGNVTVTGKYRFFRKVEEMGRPPGGGALWTGTSDRDERCSGRAATPGAAVRPPAAFADKWWPLAAR